MKNSRLQEFAFVKSSHCGQIGAFMGIDTISAKKLSEYFCNDQYIIIDIRDKKDYEKGHIPHAINIPFDDFEENGIKLPKNKKYILYCERGGSSLLLARQMDREGFEVLSISGGLNAYRGILTKKV